MDDELFVESVHKYCIHCDEEYYVGENCETCPCCGSDDFFYDGEYDD